MKIILEVNDNEIILSVEEARKLYKELDAMFAEKNTTIINRINEYRPYQYRYYGDSILCSASLADIDFATNSTTISLQGKLI